MEENRIVKIRENVFHIYESLGVWCTLITGSKAALLIDTGFGFGDISGKVRKLTDLPLTVINTHGHVDHIQGNKFFDTVLLHEDDRRIIKFYSSFLVKLFIYLGAQKTLSPEEKRNVPEFFKRNVQKLQYIHDGHLIDLGDRVLEVIHTPGHTKGSVCILDTKDRILFSGDSISSHVWLFLKESTSVKKYMQSISNVIQRKEEFDSIVSSHSSAVFKTTILEKILHCAEHIDVSKSTVYDSHMAGKGLLYSEGFEKIQAAYGYDTFEEFLKHTGEIAPEEIADIEFVSIVYTKKKLG
jgi:glyoxylase-like metal-dependent hydrolase (beta-lactamase superfamily II)